MADIAPLTPLRYDLARFKDLARVTAPPYDVIGPEERAALAARDPHNIVKLILPEGEGDAKYENARKLFTAWREEGALVRDEEPAFYRYEQTFTPPGAEPGSAPKKRRGFLGLVRVVPLDKGIVLPHERTLSGPREDRFRLFSATKTNFSPGFQLYSDPARALDAALDTAKVLTSFTTDDGIAHELAKVTSKEAIKAIVDGVAKSSLLIADGHHRYETALRYAQEHGQNLPPSAEPRWFLVFFANGDDPNLLVFPTHRLVHSLPQGSPGTDFAAAMKGAEALFDVTPLEANAQASSYLDALARSGQKTPSLVACATDGRAALLALKSPSTGIDASLAAHPILGSKVKELRTTDVALLHMGILEPVLGITPEMQAAKTNIRYPQDAAAALAELRAKAGNAQMLFLMNGTPVDQVRRVAEAGEVMPQKSTFFFPKVITGLCIHTLEADRAVPTV